MKTRTAGETAKAGFYFNLRTWELDLHRKDGALPGGENDRYTRVPTAALLILGPAMGFLFVIFLPFIGFALFTREVGHRVGGWFARKPREAAKATNTTR
jgi:hypothetical protein